MLYYLAMFFNSGVFCLNVFMGIAYRLEFTGSGRGTGIASTSAALMMVNGDAFQCAFGQLNHRYQCICFTLK